MLTLTTNPMREAEGYDMGKYDALFEDEEGVFGGSPQGKYWQMFNELNDGSAEGVLDAIIEKMAAMELMLMETVHEDELNDKVEQFIVTHPGEVDRQKQNLYMELGGELIGSIS